MEYMYAAMLLHSAGKEISEDAVTNTLTAAGVSADSSRVKALSHKTETPVPMTCISVQNLGKTMRKAIVLKNRTCDTFFNLGRTSEWFCPKKERIKIFGSILFFPQ